MGFDFSIRVSKQRTADIINCLTESTTVRMEKAGDTASFIVEWFNDLALVATSLRIGLRKLQPSVIVFLELPARLRGYITLDLEAAVIEECSET